MPNQIATSVDVVAHILESNPDVAHIIFATYPQKTTPLKGNNVNKRPKIHLDVRLCVRKEQHPPSLFCELLRKRLIRLLREIERRAMKEATRQKVRSRQCCQSDSVLYVRNEVTNLIGNPNRLKMAISRFYPVTVLGAREQLRRLRDSRCA